MFKLDVSKKYLYCGHVPHLWPHDSILSNSKSSEDTYFFRSKDSASKGEVHLSSAPWVRMWSSGLELKWPFWKHEVTNVRQDWGWWGIGKHGKTWAPKELWSFPPLSIPPASRALTRRDSYVSSLPGLLLVGCPFIYSQTLLTESGYCQY